MCLSNNRYPRPAINFTGTILLGMEVEVDGQIEHVLGYYNKVSGTGKGNQSKSADEMLMDAERAITPAPGKPTRRGSRPMSLTAPRRRTPSQESADDFDWNTPDKPGKPATIAVGNAMLIAVPAKPGTLTGKSLIPVSDFPNFMQDYARAVGPRTVQSDSMRRGRGGLLGAKSIEVVKGFDKGTYDVVIAGSAKVIAGAIEQVDADKRPVINEELYAKLDKLYPKWTFVLFCFSEATAEKAGCALMRYQPMEKHRHLLYLPGLDGHNGDIETGDVALDHTLVVGSCKMSKSAPFAREVEFTDWKFRSTLPFMCDRVIGKVVPKGTMVPQGDFLFKLDEVRAGTVRARRMLPPGWSKVYGKSDAKPFYIEN